ncbi:hypothetical protein Btru_021377, partial [Bulinus truncatus]
LLGLSSTMSHKVLLVSLLIVAVQLTLVNPLPLLDDIAELHPVHAFTTDDVDSNLSDELESVTDFLENIFGSDDNDDFKRHDADSHEDDGGHDSKVTDFMENMFGDDGNARLASGIITGGASLETDIRLNRDDDSRENGSRSDEKNNGDNRSDDKDKNNGDRDGNRSDDKDNKSADKDNKSADKDKNKSDDGDDDRSNDKDDSGTCPAYPVNIDDHKVTITTQDGCKIVIKLPVLLGDKDISVHDDKGRTVRTLELSYDD